MERWLSGEGQWLLFQEDQGWVPHTQMATIIPVSGFSDTLFWPLSTETHTVLRRTHRQNKCFSAAHGIDHRWDGPGNNVKN